MAKYSDLNIDAGSSFSSIITVDDVNGLPFNLTGYSARGQIRKSYASLTAINFATVINNPTSGKIAISLTAATTRTLKAGRYVFDVEIYNISDDVIRIAEGQVNVDPSVTRLAALPSSISTLSNLEISYGLLSPVFKTDTFSYSLSFPNITTSIAVTPSVTDIHSTIKVNGVTVESGTSSIGIALTPGVNVVTILVTAQDGITSSIYTITCNI